MDTLHDETEKVKTRLLKRIKSIGSGLLILREHLEEIDHSLEELKTLVYNGTNGTCSLHGPYVEMWPGEHGCEKCFEIRFHADEFSGVAMEDKCDS